MLRGLLSSCSKQGPLSGSSMRASLCRGFSQWGAQALGHVGSEVAAPGPWSSSSKIVVPGLSCSLACRILPDQGLNPCLPTESVLNPFSTQVNFWDLYIPAEGRRQKRGRRERRGGQVGLSSIFMANSHSHLCFINSCVFLH